MKTNRSILVIFAVFFSMSIFVLSAGAHDFWISMDKYHLDSHATGQGTAFSSHRFPAPADDVLAPERLEAVLFITPDGQRIPAAANGAGAYAAASPFAKAGTYVAVALPVNGFATKTPDGYQRGKSRKDVESAIYCRFSQKFAKAVFSVGRPGGDAYAKPLGHAMEIIPLKDPSLLKTGDILPVKVLLNGKPLRTNVYGTYAGFSESANTFAYTTRTDKQGVANIKMIHGGTWVLIAKEEQPYEDPSTCDTRTWAASLTFGIQ